MVAFRGTTTTLKNLFRSKKGGKYSGATQSLWPSARAWFFLFYLQRSFFVCSVRFLFAAFRLFAVGIFYLQRSFLFAAYFFLFAAYFFYLQRTFFICSVLFYLQRSFFVCSVSFLFVAFLFCLQRFFFVCSVSLVGHRINEERGNFCGNSRLVRKLTHTIYGGYLQIAALEQRVHATSYRINLAHRECPYS